MPYKSRKQQILDEASKGKDLPEEAEAGKGPTRTQGPGKASDTSRTVRKVSREQNKDMKPGGFHSTPKGKKGYTRKEKHKDSDMAQSTELTEIDETYRNMQFPLSSLNWNQFVQARPCGDQEAYPEKCVTDGPNGGGGYNNQVAPQGQEQPQDYRMTNVPQSPRPKLIGNPPRPLNDYDKKWHDVDYYLQGEYDDYNDLKEKADSLGLHGEDTEELVKYLQDEQFLEYEALEMLHEHYMDKWEKMNPDPFKNTASLNGSKIAADLTWSTHKSETFDDTGENGEHPAWGFKSIIDRGVKPHEKSSGDKNINPDHQTQKRKVSKKNFKAFSHVLTWEL